MSLTIIPVDPATAHVVASGIPGAGAITQVGNFHPGSPIHDKPSSAASTQPGAILDPDRILVASTSNFAAPLARPGDPAGAILSLATTGDLVAVPEAFAAGGGQASALRGAVQLFTAQSPAFVNGVNNPGAATKDLPAVSLPLGVSINNAFGRPWFANAPNGRGGDGTITVIDPNGVPLSGAPDPVAGGVFSGSDTNRSPATTHGLTAAAVGTALVTKSPDGSGRAVFFAALADGSVVQVHVQRGVDGLAPAGSFTPLGDITPAAAESADPGTVTRAGMAFNWVPNRVLYVSDPLGNRVLALDISDDGVTFSAAPARYLSTWAFDLPVDIAASSPEVASGNFSSDTTLGGGSDLYVVNRGDNTVVRMRQDGDVLAVRAIEPDVSLPGFRANGIAVSPDGQTLWIAATAPGGEGYVLRMAAFGAGFVTESLVASATTAGAKEVATAGASMFSQELSPGQRVGPLFNARSCNECHGTPFPGGMDTEPFSEVRVARITSGQFGLVQGGPVARAHSIAELGVPCGLPTGVPPEANVTSRRLAMTLRGTGLIDDILASDILATQVAQPAEVRGHPNLLADGRIGKFGWKAQIPTLVEFMGDAFRTEMGVTNPLAPRDLVDGCGADLLRPEMDAVPLQDVTAFMGTLDPPAATPTCITSAGAAKFQEMGCAQCHTPSLPSQGKRAQLYSDLLLHEMGPGLADGFPDGSASGSEFRTMPLWRVSDRVHFLHDGRASSILEAIQAHGGQAAAAAQAFQALSAADRQALLDFLGCI